VIRESFPPAGVVILYRPQVDVVENIRSYLDDVGLLVIVDNSPVALPEILELSRSSGKIVYHGGRVNRGIAAALNIGAEEAMSRGY
jgi:rhamnosyltransferase